MEPYPSISQASPLRTHVQLPLLDLGSPASLWHEHELTVFLTSLLPGEPPWWQEFLTNTSLLRIPTVLSRRVWMQVLIEYLVLLLLLLFSRLAGLEQNDATAFPYQWLKLCSRKTHEPTMRDSILLKQFMFWATVYFILRRMFVFNYEKKAKVSAYKRKILIQALPEYPMRRIVGLIQISHQILCLARWFYVPFNHVLCS